MATKKAAAKAEVKPEAKKFLDGYRVLAVQVENIKKIAFARIRPAGHVVLVNGDNESGKTTLLDSINWALAGTSDIPTMPVSKGKKNGKIQLELKASHDLGNLRVTRYFTAVDPNTNPKGHGYISRIEVEEQSGIDKTRYSTMREPQKVLDALRPLISFNPLAFTTMKPKEQFEVLRGLVKLDIDLDANKKDYDEAYAARRDAGRDVDGLTVKLKGMAEPPSDLPSTPVNTEELTRKLQNAANHNSTVEAARTRKVQHEELIELARNRASQLREEAQQKLNEAEALDGLHRDITVIPRGAVVSEISKLKEVLDSIVPGEPIDTNAVALELQNAQGINGAIARAEQYRAVKKELDEAMVTWGKHDAAVKKTETDRAGAIARAKMPVDGLSIGDGEVMFEGLPFEQASNAQQIRISVMLGICANPKLRVMYIEDGSLLGAKMMALIEAMAQEFNYQIWIERVDTTSKIGIMMVDGEASGDEVETVK